MSIYPPEFVQSIYKSFRATWLGFIIIIFTGITVSVIINRIYGPMTAEKDIINFILILNVCLATGMIIFGFRIYNIRVREAVNEGRHLPDKLNRYRSAIAILLVVCTFPLFICLFGFLITGNFYIFIVIAMCLGFILFKAPSRSKVVSELQLSARDNKDLG